MKRREFLEKPGVSAFVPIVERVLSDAGLPVWREEPSPEPGRIDVRFTHSRDAFRVSDGGFIVPAEFGTELVHVLGQSDAVAARAEAAGRAFREANRR